MSDEQQNRFSGFRERMTQVEKDIGRTDRSHPFYSGEDNANVSLLQDILDRIEVLTWTPSHHDEISTGIMNHLNKI